jgi:hypothetical protein
LIYQPTRAAAKPVEYRDVRDVDGKPVRKRNERALAVIQRARNSEVWWRKAGAPSGDAPPCWIPPLA